jgi:hypothetical protein
MVRKDNINGKKSSIKSYQAKRNGWVFKERRRMPCICRVVVRESQLLASLAGISREVVSILLRE